MVDSVERLLRNYDLSSKNKDAHYSFSNYNSKEWDLLPNYGFKIHISATKDNAELILNKFLKYYSNNKDLLFKVTASVDKLSKQNIGFFGLSQVGKFITIYPRSEEELLSLLINLELLFKFDRSIRIPSDKSFLNSEIVYYRYGEFKFSSDNIDKRKNENIFYKKLTFHKYNQLPNKYVILEILQKSGNNGVYKVLDLNSKNINILKESVPFGAISNNNVDSVNRKINEFFVLSKMNADFVPKALDIFWINESLCVVTEKMDGVKLGKIVVSNIGFNQRMMIFLDLLKKVITIHQKYDVVLNDISMNNILVDSKNQVHIIDFEMSQYPEAFYDAEKIGTMGFYDHDYSIIDYSQDIFSLGKILFYLLSPTKYQKNILKNTQHSINDFTEICLFEDLLVKTDNHKYNSAVDFYNDFNFVLTERKIFKAK